MRLLTIIFVLFSTYCYPQRTYDELLKSRIEEISKLTSFNNSVVVFTASEGYGSDYFAWHADQDFYQGDRVFDKNGKFYEALLDSKDKQPDTSHNEWRLLPFAHPYFFLRDTAKTEDLKKLLTHKHAYVKVYAFGALANRNEKGLYKVLLDNLTDTTQIDQMTGDYGYPVCPADLLVGYLIDDMAKEEKDELRMLIETNCPHLVDARKWLESK